MIHDQQPHLSFETVTQNSHYYNQFIENLSKKHINKYKNKIIYFWDELQRKVDT